MNFYEFYNIKLTRPQLRWDGNRDTFKSWLMSELAGHVASDLNQWMQRNAHALPFHDLFDKGEIRKTIPLNADPKVLGIIEKINQAGLIIDFDFGTVSDGKRAIRLGKYILNKNSPFTEEERKWWINAGEAIAELKRIYDNVKNYIIVVSRSPIDIARMSDHDGWTSCHSPGSDEFKCALADAKGAGAIAYIVYKKDLEGIDLQNPEIFDDPHRRVRGISPVSRVRLRKFIHKVENYELAVPEDKTYGEEIPGLTESVRKWAFASQKEKFGGKRPRMKDFHLVGGSYEDSRSGKLFNYFFGDNLEDRAAKADYAGQEEKGLFELYEEQVSQIKRQFRNEFKFCSFYASVEESDGNPYVNYYGFFRLSIPDNLFKPSDDWDGREIKKEITNWADENNIYPVYDVGLTKNINNFYIEIRENDGDLTPDSFREFLDHNLRDIENRKEELEHSFYHLLVKLGLAKANIVYNIYNTLDDQEHFQNFDAIQSGHDVKISLKRNMPFSGPVVPPETLNQFDQTLLKELTSWADRTMKQIDPAHTPFSSELYLKLKIGPKIAGRQIDGNYSFRLNLELKPLYHDAEKAIEFIKFLDAHYNEFVALVSDVFKRTILATNTSYSQQSP